MVVTYNSALVETRVDASWPSTRSTSGLGRAGRDVDRGAVFAEPNQQVPHEEPRAPTGSQHVLVQASRAGARQPLHGHRVDWLRGRRAVVDVMTRQGLRQWPKSKKSHRVVPVPPATLEDMSVLMAGRERDALVFTAPEGGPVSDRNFANRIWFPAIAAAGVRRFPPRIIRHTAASWLVQDGVPLYDVQALLGHESFATTQRYAHLAPDAHSKVLESWARRPGAPVAHGTKKARPS